MASQHSLVIIPAFNEERTIGEVVAAVSALGYDIVVVDDGSLDRTAENAAVRGVVVLQLPINLGVGGALRAGFRYAVDHGYTEVIQVDADGQHPPRQIINLQKVAADRNMHLVIGSRYLSAESTMTQSLPRRFSMWCLGMVASCVAGTHITDTTSGFRLIREPLLSEFAKEFPNYYLGDTFEATIAALRGGYNVVEVPAALSPRLHGASSTSSAKAIALIAKVLIVALFGLHVQVKTYQDKP
jgi:glycosyltransferase involved in cell wall biosynthesis